MSGSRRDTPGRLRAMLLFEAGTCAMLLNALAIRSAPRRWRALKCGAIGLGVLVASAACPAGQLRTAVRITINLQPPEVVCTAVTNGSTTPSINCVGGIPVPLRDAQSAATDYGEFSSRLVATKEVEYIETTVSW